MEEIKIRFANSNDFDNVADLSKRFADECCCNGVKAESEEFYRDKKVLVATTTNNLIVGYLYFTIENDTKTTPYGQKGDLTLWLEELFVLPSYRKNGAGKMLFDFVEQYAKQEGCKSLRGSAVSKDYKRLLKFYIEKLGMDFWSALLIKNL
ncbi:MAG: GNAT family N-acetyltransferase [Clostridia bacterium]|nr:GNAT family N-acetyltransferase [Clostridia bacterium]